MTRIEFRVHGTPKPQGSKRHVGNGVMIESAGQPLKTWREDVKLAALRERQQLHGPLDGPITVSALFYLARPSSHYRTGRNAHLLRDSAPEYPHRKPDIDKLLRGTLDAISAAALWADDARVVCVLASKTYATDDCAPGVHLLLNALERPA